MNKYKKIENRGHWRIDLESFFESSGVSVAFFNQKITKSLLRITIIRLRSEVSRQIHMTPESIPARYWYPQYTSIAPLFNGFFLKIYGSIYITKLTKGSCPLHTHFFLFMPNF